MSALSGAGPYSRLSNRSAIDGSVREAEGGAGVFGNFNLSFSVFSEVTAEGVMVVVVCGRALRGFTAATLEDAMLW